MAKKKSQNETTWKPTVEVEAPLASVEEVPPIESIEQWDGLPIAQKKAVIGDILAINQRDIGIAANIMSDVEKNQYFMEFSYIIGALNDAQTEEDLILVIARLDVMEEALATYMPTALRERAVSTIAMMEKGLSFAPGLLPPDKVQMVREIVEASKIALEGAVSRAEFEVINVELELGRGILSDQD